MKTPRLPSNSMVKDKAFSLISGTIQGCPLLPLLFNIVLTESSSQINQARKRNNRHPSLERKNQNYLCSQMLRSCMQKTLKIPHTQTQKLLELINEYSKQQDFKINTKISVEFLYTNNDQSEKEIKKIIPFTIA